MHIPSFPSTRSLEDIHVSNAQVLLLALASLGLLVLLRCLLRLVTWLRPVNEKALLRASHCYDEKTSSHTPRERSEGGNDTTRLWKWSSVVGFGLQFESFPIALDSTHQLGLSPPALGSGAGVLNFKMGATNPCSPNVRSQARNGTHLIQPKLAKSWYIQHSKTLRNQPVSVTTAAISNQPNFETPLPAVYQSVVPVSMAKMIMSRHTFRRPGGPRRAPLLPSSRRHDVISAEDNEQETFYDAMALTTSQSEDSHADTESTSSQRQVPTTSMV